MKNFLLLVSCLIGLCLNPAFGEGKLEKVFSVDWGTASNQIGIKFLEPGILPATPFSGPGGFRVGIDGSIWISDSINGSIKKFSKGKVDAFRVMAEKLGDLFLFESKVFVCTLNPNGIKILDSQTGVEEKFIPMLFKNPRRLLVQSANKIAVEEMEGGTWILFGNNPPFMHSAKALEAVGNSSYLFGTLFDFDPLSRKIIRANWSEKNVEPELFTIYRSTGGELVFSKLVGQVKELPVLMTLCAQRAEALDFTFFDSEGKVSKVLTGPPMDVCYFPSTWIIGNDENLYGVQADLKSLSIFRLM